MPEITQDELTAAIAFFDGPLIVTKPRWVQEARVILRQRRKGHSLRRIAKVLGRALGGMHNPQTTNRRLAWAIDTYRTHSDRRER